MAPLFPAIPDNGKNSSPMGNSQKIGVVLFQLGGPDSLDAVEPFLYNLFSDPDIIDFPFAKLAREPLARLMASWRAKKVSRDYDIIGGKSPLKELTLLQAAALEKELAKICPAKVRVAMRYWHPFTEEAIKELETESLEQLVLLPLYPQYSKTTTGSSLNEWNRIYAASRMERDTTVPVRIVPKFYDDTKYLEALVDNIQCGLDQLTCKDGVHLVFSAHGIPLSVIEAGDPYQQQTEATMQLVMKGGGWGYPHTLCYQSRVGPGRWLAPTLESTLRLLAGQGTKSVFVIPISFVSDHIETLKEIDIEGREIAQEAGIAEFGMMPALNDSPKFIKALADLVMAATAGDLSQSFR